MKIEAMRNSKEEGDDTSLRFLGGEIADYA